MTLPDAADWVPAPVPPEAEILEASGVSPRLAKLLARRGVADPEAADRFLRPRPEHLHDPMALAGMAEAVERLASARETGSKVAVVGDYDVDGVTSTALLTAVFRALGLEVEPILPHRIREGYGFQPVHVERARAKGCGLIVTADCGTSSIAAVTAAQEAGLDVIVTDHHLPGPEPLPEGTILINPCQESCSYPFGELAAVGLAFKLALAFGRKCGRDLPLDALLRMACLGTIADLVPLVGENRVIASLGLEALGETPSEGLRALFRRASIRPPFSAVDVGFRIGPRLNAAGRLDDAHAALELLLTRDVRRAGDLANALDRFNRRRQEEERRVVDEARKQILSRTPLPRFVAAWSESWHRGVVGIAAGRLAKEFHRPVVLLSVDGDLATGSGRSIPGLGLHEFLSRWKDRYVRFGGHAQAVGLTVSREHVEDVGAAWDEGAGEWPEELLVRRHEYELEVAPREAGEALLEELDPLEPHGQANRRPLLRVGPLRVSGSPRRFGRDHLSAETRGLDDGPLRLIGWGWGKRADDLEGTFEVLGYLERDTYRGGLRLRLVDARPVEENT